MTDLTPSALEGETTLNLNDSTEVPMPTRLWQAVSLVAWINLAGTVITGLMLVGGAFWWTVFRAMGDVTRTASSVPFLLSLLAAPVIIVAGNWVLRSLRVDPIVSTRRRLAAVALIAAGNLAAAVFALVVRSGVGVVFALGSLLLILFGYCAQFGIPAAKQMTSVAILAVLVSPLAAAIITPASTFAVYTFASARATAEELQVISDQGLTEMTAESVHRSARAYAAYENFDLPTVVHIAQAATDADAIYDPATGKITFDGGTRTWYVCPTGQQSTACNEPNPVSPAQK